MMAARLDEMAPRKSTPSRALMIPKEHGAWVMLGAATLAGLAGSRRIGLVHLPLVATALGVFLFQEPVRAAVRARRLDPLASRSILVYSALSLAAVAWLAVWRAPLAPIAVLAALGAAGFGTEIWALWSRKERTILGELLAVALLSLPSAAGPLLVEGEDPRHAFALWTLCFLFLGGSVFSVKLLVRARRWAGSGWAGRVRANGASLAWLSLSVAAASALAALGWLPVLAPLGMAPAFARAGRALATRADRAPSLVRIGFTELAYCSVFCALVATAYAVAR